MSSQQYSTLEADLGKIRTKTAKQLIAPLVYLITSLNTDYCKDDEVNSSSDNGGSLLRVKDTLENFVHVGQEIIQSNPAEDGMQELGDSLEKIWVAGSSLLSVGAEFSKDSNDSVLQSAAIEASRFTLAAMVKLLLIADMLDSKRNPGDVVEKEDDTNEHIKSQLSENDRLRLTQYLPGEDADNELSEQVINEADIGKAVLDGKLEKDVQSGVETGVKKPTVPTPGSSQDVEVKTGWTNSLSDPASVYTKGPGWFKKVHSHSSWKRRG